MAYPGAATDIKSYLWKSVCQPVLMYGLDGIPLYKNCITCMDTTQGNVVKQSLGPNKRVHITNLL